jgi:hypothetical protein
MSFGRNKVHKLLPTSERILECVSDFEIFEYYLGGIPKKAISSPLRGDATPSFSLFKSDEHNKIFFKDFATGESGDCFLFVMRLFKLGSKVETFNKIASDFALTQFELNSSSRAYSRQTFVKKENRIKTIKNTKVRISVRTRDWKIRDKEYWQNIYGLNKNQLEFCKIFPISHFFVNGYCSEAESLAYAFVEEKDNVQTFKIYQPFAGKDDKWINNNDFSTWELWTQMPKSGKNLIIASSRKDAAVLKTIFSSEILTSCSLQSESVNAKESVINELKGRFENIYVLYDNDFNSSINRGRVAGVKLCSQSGFTQIEIPDEYGVKDPSDFIEKYGKLKLQELISTLININIKNNKS